mgnify:CR=1 FL=1
MLRKIALLALCALVLTVIPACGKGAIKTEGVTGKVTFNGAPLADATVFFIPVGEGNQSYGKTDANGVYKLQTLLGAADAGTTPGKYQVRFEAVENVPTGKMLTDSTTGEEYERVDVQSVIPRQYTDEKTSGFEVEVVKGSNTFDFDLTD